MKLSITKEMVKDDYKACFEMVHKEVKKTAFVVVKNRYSKKNNYGAKLTHRIESLCNNTAYAYIKAIKAGRNVYISKSLSVMDCPPNGTEIMDGEYVFYVDGWYKFDHALETV